MSHLEEVTLNLHERSSHKLEENEGGKGENKTQPKMKINIIKINS